MQSRERIRRYLITMGIRTGCFIAAIVTDGWIRWVCVALAAVLPLVAVLLANAGGDPRRVQPARVDRTELPARPASGEAESMTDTESEQHRHSTGAGR